MLGMTVHSLPALIPGSFDAAKARLSGSLKSQLSFIFLCQLQDYTLFHNNCAYLCSIV